MTGAATNEPGIVEKFTIDGVTYDCPSSYQPDTQLAQTLFQTMAGTQIIQGAYRGDGLPDRPDNFSFVLPYQIDDNNAAMADQIELLRVTPGPHFFADWKQRYIYYTLRPGQSFLYLPREDAHSRAWLAGILSAAFVPAWTGTAQTVLYKATVAAGDAVPANEIWISNTVIQHPDSGRWVAPFKLGSPPGVPSTLVGKYIPLFRVDVVNVSTDFRDRVAGREDKVLVLTEVN